MHILDSFINHEKEHGKSPETIRGYHYKLLHFEKWLGAVETDLYEFSRSDVQQYLDDLTSQKKSASTVNGHYAAIRSFSQFAKKTDCIKDIRIVKAPNLYREAPVALERKEVLRILREVDRSGNKRDKAILLTCVYAGIRVAEIVSLDIDDISFSERQGTIRVRQGKGNKERIIPLHKEARYAISDY